MSKASGSYGTDPVLYHNTPFDLNWGWLVNLDHDFIGRDALAKLKADPPRKLVTLVWDKDDVADVFASLFRSESYEYMEMPRNLLGNVVGSSVSVGSQTIGYAVSRCYSYWFKEMISLGIVLKEHASPGTEVSVKWGSEGSKQKIIKAVSLFIMCSGVFGCLTFAYRSSNLPLTKKTRDAARLSRRLLLNIGAGAILMKVAHDLANKTSASMPSGAILVAGPKLVFSRTASVSGLQLPWNPA